MRRRLALTAGTDKGSAMVIALLVMSVLTGLGTIVFIVGSSNLQNAGKDRLAGGAQGAAEAGVAQAIAFIRSNGTASLTCNGPFTTSTVCSQDYGYNYPTAGAGGHTVSLSNGRAFSVWVEKVQSYSPTVGQKEGIYRVTSVGTAGSGPGSRKITVLVRTKPLEYPLGVFGRESVRNGGTPRIQKESMFSAGCIGKRKNITFDEQATDLAYPELVPGAHSAKYVSEALIAGLLDADCKATERTNIHSDPTPGDCNSTYRFDSDLLGGPTTGTVCAPSNNGNRGLTTSYFDSESLKNYGYTQSRGLSNTQYDQIRQKAQEQGNYYNCSGGSIPPGACNGGNLSNFTVLNGSTLPNAVVYIKMGPGKKVDFGPGELIGYGTQYCGTRSLLIVIEGGDLHFANNTDIVAATFVPDGEIHMNGSASIVGTLFAKDVFLNGSGNITLKDQCFFDNLPGGLLSAAPTKYREIDR